MTGRHSHRGRLRPPRRGPLLLRPRQPLPPPEPRERRVARDPHRHHRPTWRGAAHKADLGRSPGAGSDCGVTRTSSSRARTWTASDTAPDPGSAPLRRPRRERAQEPARRIEGRRAPQDESCGCPGPGCRRRTCRRSRGLRRLDQGLHRPARPGSRSGIPKSIPSDSLSGQPDGPERRAAARPPGMSPPASRRRPDDPAQAARFHPQPVRAGGGCRYRPKTARRHDLGAGRGLTPRDCVRRVGCDRRGRANGCRVGSGAAVR